MATDHFVRQNPGPSPPLAIPQHSSHHHHHQHQHNHQRRQQQQPHQHSPVPVPIPCPAMAQQQLWLSPPLPPRPLARSAPDRPAVEEPMDLTDDRLELPPMASDGGPSSMLLPLPHPNETPSNEDLPPEMEEATLNWRLYAAATLFHGRKLTGPARQISQEMDDMEEEEDPEEGFRERRTTVTYRFPTNSNSTTSEELSQQRRRAVARKLSMGHQRHSADDRAGCEEQLQQHLSPRQLRSEQRRLSFPERSLLNANYAILRKSVDRFEVVGAFHRCHSEAYRHFLQSLTCYDLVPQHGLIVMLDAELTIQKAVQILCAHPAPRVAVISNAKEGQWAMFTVTDCMLALHRAHRQLDAELGGRSLRYFFEHMKNGRRLISVDDQSSVWDLARVFALNRVHRVPVFSADTLELVGILCPRAICMELLKLLASKCSLSPDLHSTPISAQLVGTWGINEIAAVTEGDTCAQAVNLFLERQVSALPVLSAQQGTLLGVLDKNNLMDRLFERLGSHQSPERCFQLMEETPVEDLLPQSRRRTVQADISLAEAIRLLTEDGLSESLFVVEPVDPAAQSDQSGDRLCGVLSHTDVLAFILSCEQQQQQQCPQTPVAD